MMHGWGDWSMYSRIVFACCERMLLAFPSVSDSPLVDDIMSSCSCFFCLYDILFDSRWLLMRRIVSSLMTMSERMETLFLDL